MSDALALAVHDDADDGEFPRVPLPLRSVRIPVATLPTKRAVICECDRCGSVCCADVRAGAYALYACQHEGSPCRHCDDGTMQEVGS